MIKSNWGHSTEITRAAGKTRDYRFGVDIHMGDGGAVKGLRLGGLSLEMTTIFPTINV